MTRRVLTGLACLLACLSFTSVGFGQTETYQFFSPFDVDRLVPQLTLTIDTSETGTDSIASLVFGLDDFAGFFPTGTYSGTFESLSLPLTSDGELLLADDSMSMGSNAVLTDSLFLPPSVDPPTTPGGAGLTVNSLSITFAPLSNPVLGIAGGAFPFSARITYDFTEVDPVFGVGTTTESFAGDFVRIPEPATATVLIGAMMSLGCIARRRS